MWSRRTLKMVSKRYQSTAQSRGFYKLLNIPETANQQEIAEAYQIKCETLSTQLSTANEEQMEKILEDIYNLDKAIKVLKDPFSKRDYDMKLKLNKLDELEEEDADNHYRNLFSDKSYNDYMKKKEEEKLKRAADKLAQASRTEGHNSTKNREPQTVSSHGLNPDECSPEEDRLEGNKILKENMKYVSYFWGAAICIGGGFYAYKQITSTV